MSIRPSKGPASATRNDFVNDIVDDERADAIFATLKTIVDDIVTCGRALTAWLLRFIATRVATLKRTTPLPGYSTVSEDSPEDSSISGATACMF